MTESADTAMFDTSNLPPVIPGGGETHPGEAAPQYSLEELMLTPEVQAKIAELAAASTAKTMTEMAPDLIAAAVSKAMAAASSKPPLTMKANIADRFITEANGQGRPIKHYRCDRAVSVKLVEMDMDLLERYLADPTLVPEGKTARSAAWIKGKWISWIGGHCYCHTDNQVRNVLWIKAQPTEMGGMPDIYEDFGSSEQWPCPVASCSGLAPFTNRQTWDAHMEATHGVARGSLQRTA